MLTIQLFVEGFHLFDKEVNTYIFPNGILLSFFMKEDFDPFIAYIFLVFWEYILNLNLFGLCVQFIYRYLVLNSYIFLIPVFNPIICILTNTPYRNAVFNRLRINPQ
uniref:Uncharacterized protein n=1 Tax=Meloidogyne enterolobii TaxID=390850 RepID=A0A6V7WJ35_MELEN|nr:unnamed protein product [Meloidogyne enterolobii]